LVLFVGFWGHRGNREKIKEIEPQIALIYTEKQLPSKSRQKWGLKNQGEIAKFFEENLRVIYRGKIMETNEVISHL
jgi:uncharacterized 2Fe-2S/4Fe-4S cluster protein (DUF4445 family)